MTKSNALYWRNQIADLAYWGLKRENDVPTHSYEGDSFEIIDGQERYLVEVRVFDLGGDE